MIKSYLLVHAVGTLGKVSFFLNEGLLSTLVFATIVLLEYDMYLSPSHGLLRVTGLQTPTLRSAKICWCLLLLEGLNLRQVTTFFFFPFLYPLLLQLRLEPKTSGVSLCCYEIVGTNCIRTFGHVPVVTMKGWVHTLLDFVHCFDTSLPPLAQVFNEQPFIAFLTACVVLVALPAIQGLGSDALAPAQVYTQK